MRIKRLYLKGYQRLSLNHIDSIDYRPQEKMQVILGTNGSGKSSLLYELSPLPAVSQMYAKDGLKEITIEHRGSTYILKSHFGESKTHSFIKDGIELNTGNGTQAVQKQLVLEHFGLSNKIHELMLGITQFTQMSISERRDWFTLLSDTNYDYALKVFIRLKERLRDTQGAIKTLKKTLALQVAKSYSKKEVTQLEERVKSLYELVVYLQDKRVPEQKSIDEYPTLLESISSQIQRTVEALEPTLRTLKRIWPDISQIDSIAHQAQEEIIKYKALSEQYYKDHEKMNEEFRALEQTKDKTLSEVNQEMNELLIEIDHLESCYNFQLPKVTYDEIIYSIQTAVDTYSDIYPTLVKYLNAGYSPAVQDELLKKIAHLENQIPKAQAALEQSNGILEHLNALLTGKPTVCPNCNHQWIAGYDKALFEKHTERKQRAIEKLKEWNEDLKACKEKLSEVNDYLLAKQHLSSLINKTPKMRAFWDQCLAHEYFTTSPDRVHLDLSLYLQDANTYLKVTQLKKLAQDKKELALKLSNIKQGDYQLLSQKRQELSESIAKVNALQTKSEKTLKNAIRAKELIESLKALESQLKQEVSNYNKAYSDLNADLARNGFNESLRMIQSALAQTEQQYSEVSNIQKSIDDLQAQITQLETEEKLLKTIVKELSPQEGLIAEGLFRFMHLFVQQMNSIIKRIWTYPLEVKPCSIADDGSIDLDYKFPIMVDLESQVRKDICEGSSAMKEVINLAFKIAALKALKMNDWPLFLDEFGSTMDPVHKAATIELMNTIMEQDHFTQGFMISHDALQYGALSNTEVLVLSEENMMLDKNSVYNQNVIINEVIKE